MGGGKGKEEEKSEGRSGVVKDSCVRIGSTKAEEQMSEDVHRKSPPNSPKTSFPPRFDAEPRGIASSRAPLVYHR